MSSLVRQHMEEKRILTPSGANPGSTTKTGSAAVSIDLERILCPKCGSDDSVVVFQGKDYRYHSVGDFYASECGNCGLWFQNPRPTSRHLVNIYPEDYLPHAKPPSRAEPAPIRPGKIKYLRRHLGYDHLVGDSRKGYDWSSLGVFDRLWKWRMGVTLIPHYVSGGKLLEIGCASGAQLLFFRQLGWEHLYGVELVPKASETARALGFLVECGPIETVLGNYPDEYFDVIFSTMVIEHLLDPFRVMHDIASKLKPGGQFLFSTIVHDSLDAKMFGPYWYGFMFPRHMVYFQKRDIYEMLGDHFEQVECFYQSAPQDFVQPATWRREYGASKFIDWPILALDRSIAANVINVFLAWLGLTSRVSFRCRRKA